MERRQVTGRRAKEMASNLIREVAGKKDRHSSSEQNKQLKGKESVPAAGSLQSIGTRIACIPVHRWCQDAKMASPKKAATAAECSPRTKHATRSCHLAETCASQSNGSGTCSQSVNAFHGRTQSHAEGQAGERKEVDVRVKTPEKCCGVAKMQKTSSPVATDLCTVSLSRLVIPEKNNLSGAIKKKESEAIVHPVVRGDCLSTTKMNLFVPANTADNDTACNGENRVDSSSLPASITYPSCEQNVFLGNFGLASKAELPHLRNAAGNRLHREIGGKLRRGIKPNVAAQMMYRRTNSMRCVSFQGSTETSRVGLSSRSLHASRESSPRSLHTHNLASVSLKKLSSALSKRLKSSNVVKMDTDLSAETCKPETSGSAELDSQKQPQSSLSILADMALADLEANNTHTGIANQLMQDVMKKSTAKSKGFVKSKSMVEWSTSDVLPSRRSSRNFGVQRRAWHHLLRANPDEHDPTRAGQNSTESSPGREHTGQRTRLSKSCVLKSAASDSVESDISSTSQKPSVGHHARVSQKGLVFDRKRSHKKLTADLAQSSKKPRYSSVSRPVKENAATSAAAAVPSQSGITYRFTDNGLVHSEHEPAPDLSFLSYSYKELECVTPHMCNACWVNDHMYCRNTKSVADKFPNLSGCIHFIACEHYRQSCTPFPTSQDSRRTNMSLHWTNVCTGYQALSSHKAVSAEDLLCDEDMLDSESDVSNDDVEDTDVLHIQLKARTDQIFRSLGVSELPRSKSPPMYPQSVVVPEEDDVTLVPEEYAAEIVINTDGECVQDVTEIHSSSQAAVASAVAWRQESETFVVDKLHWNGNHHQEPRHNASSSICSLSSFDGTSPCEPPVDVKVHVRPISDNRVIIKYPKYHTSPTEYVHLDVTFPNGATNEVVSDYVRNDVARFICEKKSHFTPDVSISVTVVKDDKLSRTADEENSVRSVQHVTEFLHDGLQSAVNTAETVACPSSRELMDVTMPAVLDEHDQLTDCVAEVTPVIDSPVNRDDLLSRLQTVYEELDRLQDEAAKKERWRDGVVEILMQKHRIVKGDRLHLARLCKEKAEIQTRLESLQRKSRKLQSDRNSGVQLIKLLDSLLSAETDADSSAQAYVKCEPVIRNSCALTSSSSSVPSPAVSPYKSVERPDPSAAVLPLPVQNLNLEITDFPDTLPDIAPVSQGSAAVPNPLSSFFSAVTIPGSVTQTTNSSASQKPVPVSTKPSDNKSSNVSSAYQSSLLPHCRPQSSAIGPVNGLIISTTAGSRVSKAKTLAAKMQRAGSRTLASSKRAVVIAPVTPAAAGDISSSGKTTSVRIHNGQLVHLTVPTTWNMTGANVQVRQFVSLAPRGNVTVCSGTGVSSVPCTTVNVACSQPSGTYTTTAKDTLVLHTNKVLQQSTISSHQFQSPAELQNTPVCSSLVTSDALPTQSVSSDSASWHSSVAEVPASCSTPPFSYDEDSHLDATICETGAPESSLVQDRIIPIIPTPDPSCSSQE